MAPTHRGWDRLGSSYDRVAARYEAQFIDELDGKPRDRELLEGFASSVGDPVLEIGCGPGQVGAFIRRHGRVVIGLDLSLERAKLGRRRLDSVVAGDMRGLPARASSVSAVLAFYALIHVPRTQTVDVLREFRRVLRPRGRLLLAAHAGRGEVEATEFLGESVALKATLFELDELVSDSQTAGFEVLRAVERAPYPSEGEGSRLYIEAQSAPLLRT